MSPHDGFQVRTQLRLPCAYEMVHQNMPLRIDEQIRTRFVRTYAMTKIYKSARSETHPLANTTIALEETWQRLAMSALGTCVRNCNKSTCGRAT